MINKISYLLLLLFTALTIDAQEIAEDYINQFGPIAVSEMSRTGIPASVKLAQGLLESDWGRSELSQFAHNHFGIKCGGSWEGRTYYKVDDDYDKKGRLTESCFRVFAGDEASYIAHSEFLLQNQRYGFLFEYDATDYKAWAKGLKKAGYATDPSYPSKIIGVIHKYDLTRFDYMDVDGAEILVAQEEDFFEEEEETEELLFAENSSSSPKKTKKRNRRNPSNFDKATASIGKEVEDFTKNFREFKKNWNNKSDSADITKNEIAPASESVFNMDAILQEIQSIGENILKRDAQQEEAITSFPDLSRHNDVRMVLSEVGETLADVALREGVSIDALVEYNDGLYEAKQTLANGTTIYLETKKSSYSGSRKAHQIVAGETVTGVSQRYGVTEKSLRKRNFLKSNEEVKHGELLYLKGIRKIKRPALAQTSKQEVLLNFDTDTDK